MILLVKFSIVFKSIWQKIGRLLNCLVQSYLLLSHHFLLLSGFLFLRGLVLDLDQIHESFWLRMVQTTNYDHAVCHHYCHWSSKILQYNDISINVQICIYLANVTKGCSINHKNKEIKMPKELSFIEIQTMP